MNQTQPNFQNNGQLKILFIIPQLVYHSPARLLVRSEDFICLSTLQNKATFVPSHGEATTKRAKCINSRRYTEDRRSGVVDRNEDVSTTDDEFQRGCPRMVTGGDKGVA